MITENLFKYSPLELVGVLNFTEYLTRLPRDALKKYMFEFIDDIHEFHKEIVEKRIDVVKSKKQMSLFFDWAPNKEIINLYVMIRALNPEYIVSTGTGIGVSDAYILKALDMNGRKESMLVSLGVPSIDTDFEEGYVIPESLKFRWKHIPGLVQNTLPYVMMGLPEIDIFFHDSAHDGENQWWELNMAKKHNVKIVTMHDVHSSVAFDKFCVKNKVLGVKYGRDEICGAKAVSVMGGIRLC